MPFAVAEHRAQDDPVAVVGARAELPAAVEDVAAVDGLGHALRRVRGGHPGVDVVGPDLGGHFRVCVCQLVGVHAHYADDPAGGRVQRRGRHHGLGELARVDLKPLVTLGLQQPDQACRLHDFDGVVGEPADSFGFRGLLAQLVGRGHYPVKNPLAHIVRPYVWGLSNGLPQSVPNPKVIPVSGRKRIKIRCAHQRWPAWLGRRESGRPADRRPRGCRTPPCRLHPRLRSPRTNRSGLPGTNGAHQCPHRATRQPRSDRAASSDNAVGRPGRPPRVRLLTCTDGLQSARDRARGCPLAGKTGSHRPVIGKGTMRCDRCTYSECL